MSDRASRLVLVVLLAALIAGCGGDGDNRRASATTTSGRADSSTSTIPVPVPAGGSTTTILDPTVEFHAYNVQLLNSEESDNAFRVLVPSRGSKVLVTLKGAIPSPNEVLQVCAAPGLETHGNPSKCVAPASGTPVEIAHGPGLEAVEVVQVGTAIAGAPSAGIRLDEIVIAYEASDSTVKVRLPPLEVPLGASVCKDNGCNPFFERAPHRAGRVDAAAEWEGTGSGRLTLEAGDISAHAQSATGEPYDVIADASGGPGVAISGSVPATEAAVAFRNAGDEPILGGVVTITWP